MNSRSDATSGWITAFAPASVSNVGPGFDCFGFALQAPGDRVGVRANAEPGVRTIEISGDDGLLPREADRNTAAVAASHVLSKCPACPRGIEMRIKKGLPAGSGLGSSAASAVAGALATMRLLEKHFGVTHDQNLVLEGALQGESIASGSRHGDNVIPSLVGGFVIVQDVAAPESPAQFVRFQPKLDLSVVGVTPRISISTKQARAMLPRNVPLRDAVHNWASASGLIAALLLGDAEALRRSMCDRIVEPLRARLIPGYESVRKAASQAGALGAAISGSGPTIFAFCETGAIAEATRSAMQDAFARHELTCTSHISPISPHGARIE